MKAYLTGRDQREYKKVLLSMLGDENNPDNIDKSENVMLKAIIISVDGDKENIVERLLEMPVWDYEFALKAATEVMEGISKKKDELLSTSTTTGSEDEASGS